MNNGKFIYSTAVMQFSVFRSAIAHSEIKLWRIFENEVGPGVLKQNIQDSIKSPSASEPFVSLAVLHCTCLLSPSRSGFVFQQSRLNNNFIVRMLYSIKDFLPVNSNLQGTYIPFERPRFIGLPVISIWPMAILIISLKRISIWNVIIYVEHSCLIGRQSQLWI